MIGLMLKRTLWPALLLASLSAAANMADQGRRATVVGIDVVSYPTAVEDVLRGFSEIAEYQVEVDRSRALVELSLRIEPLKDGAAEEGEALAARVQHALHGAFNLRVPVALAPAGSLPRSEMKARRWKFV